MTKKKIGTKKPGTGTVHTITVALCTQCDTMNASISSEVRAITRCHCGARTLRRTIFIYSDDGKQVVVE